MKSVYIIIAILLCVLGFSSCERDEAAGDIMQSGSRISFCLEDDSVAVTKSGGVEKQFMGMAGADSIFIYSGVRNNDKLELPVSVKGAPFEQSGNPITSLNVAAKTNDARNFILKDKIVLTDGKGNSSRYWPESDPLNFFAWASTVTPVFKDANEAVVPEFVVESGTGGTVVCRGVFTYDMPAPVQDETDAQNQTDLVFAISQDLVKGQEAAPVNLTFHHALAAVYFKVGNMPENTTISSIALEGIKSSGNCTVSVNADSEKERDLSFVWDDVSSEKSFVQGFEDVAVTDGSDITTGEKVFMVIPQSFVGTTAKLVFKFKVGANEYTLKKDIADFENNVWEADKIYVYTISTPEEVDVEISDKVDGEKNIMKSEVKIENKGLAASYMRVAIVGNWMKGGNIVASWCDDLLDEPVYGSFVWGDGWDQNWVLHTDGFYYHLSPVEGGGKTEALFESYTITSPPPVPEASLELTLMVQAVIESEVSKAWGNGIPLPVVANE